MALSKTDKNIKRFHELHSQLKDMNRELDALKAFFREEAEESDATFCYKEIEILVTKKSRSSWDSDKLVLKLGKAVQEFKKESSYLEVTCRATMNDKAS